MSVSLVWNDSPSPATVERASTDGRYRVIIPAQVLERMRRECQRTSDRETGGILIGAYSPDLTTASVVEATAAPADSRALPTRFLRGIGGLVALLQSRWQHHGRYYVGEWHYHPHASALPSADDRQQMATISNDPEYCCRHPLLVIVGGDPDGSWQLSTTVYSATEQALIPLRPDANQG